MSDKALAIYLDAPMQSWGASSRFQRRETEGFPTKSGVIGLLAAAMGIDKHSPEEAELLRPLTELRLTVFRVAKHEAPTLRLSDFHTVGGGWIDAWRADKSNIRAKLQVSTKAGDGSPSSTVVTRRTYLTDARFLAVLEGPAQVLSDAADALLNPVWGVWFGRKCCLPSSPLTPTLADSLEAAITALAQKLAIELTPEFRSDGQQERLEPGSWYLADQPVRFGSREFVSRPVSRLPAKDITP